MAVRRVMAVLIILFAVVAAAQDASPLKNAKDKRSYALGMDLGNQLHSLGIELDPAIFSRGLSDALSGGKTLLTQEDVRAAISELQAEMKRKQAEARSKAAQDGKQTGAAFLADNKKKEGVVTLPSGLQYKILKEGTGKKPALDDTVVCQYRGTLVDGTEFDSSYKRGQPATFPVKGVIKGWTEALQLMPVGSKWQLFIPPELAYGETGAGGTIGPNATLIFEVELVSIQAKP
ncbi:MAG: FKBP-type peptidyl-prolyl cis-trans isomerase [Acidobacteriia bacterium]|nr:FKBP-type peptidyl-prolyl cis-trans isomerase [Terriglobia bacterium]